jgi:hypothetical protein
MATHNFPRRHPVVLHCSRWSSWEEELGFLNKIAASGQVYSLDVQVNANGFGLKRIERSNHRSRLAKRQDYVIMYVNSCYRAGDWRHIGSQRAEKTIPKISARNDFWWKAQTASVCISKCGRYAHSREGIVHSDKRQTRLRERHKSRRRERNGTITCTAALSSNEH